MAFVERRLPALQRVFLNLDASPSGSQSTLRRCRSFSGYTSLELGEVNCESTAEDLPWPDTDDEETVAWVEAQSADTVAPPAEGGIDGLWLTPLARPDDHSEELLDVPDYTPQRTTGFQQGFCYLPSGFTCLPHKG
ncbi:unnamed protein product [Symbiodinium natans]|uniref:Uncharacterized protein n=1 Tax=Symbiodinium natans TaxID=878477 RepID=A0A812S410_9DINO|nr:unnamed protein product [Symbiodinium natans]